MYALHGKYILERGLPLENIISKLYELIKNTTNLVETEERAHIMMYELFASLMGRVFSELNDAIANKGWKRIGKWKSQTQEVSNLCLVQLPLTTH